MNEGVLYLFCGMGAAERLVVSIHTLRQHYDGDVTVACTDEPERELVASMQPLGIKSLSVAKIGQRNGHYVTKSTMPKWSPYETTIFLDADTIVCKPIDRLFEESRKSLVLTQFATWISTGRKMSARILSAAHKPNIDDHDEYLSPFIGALCQEQVRIKPSDAAEYPGINTGVMGWPKGHAALALWHEVTMQIGGQFMADELAMQLVLPNVNAKVLPEIYNASPIHGECKPEDVVVWHFHGRKHVKREEGRKLWWPAFESACNAKVARIHRWAGRHDKTVRAHLREMSE